MQINSDHIIKMIPKNEEDILNNVIFYGGFLDTYTNLMRFVESGESSTAILRGGPGVGKKTLLDVVEKNYKFPYINTDNENNCQTPRKSLKGNKGDKIVIPLNKRKELKFIYLHPTLFSDDYTTLKYIATELELTIRPSIQDLMEDIEARKGVKHKGKIVIILLEFEQFCNSRQSLLYSLTHLTQHGTNFNLLGVTMSLDSTGRLEKRVRSRLNALFYDLTLPYNSKKQYLEFASKLLGDYNITGNLEKKLEEMYIYGTRAINHLKWFLVSICEWNKKKGLIVRQPEIDSRKSLSLGSIFYLEDKFYNLVSSQIQLLTLAACYCSDRRMPDFTLMQLGDYCSKNDIKHFDAFCPQVLKNAIILERSKLFKSTDTKLNHTIGRNTKFTLEVAPCEIAAVLQRNPRTTNVQLPKPVLSKLN